MTDPGEPLSGQQLHAMQTRMAEALQRVIDNVERRRLCLEMATKAVEGRPDLDTVQLARSMHQFLIEPALNVNVVIERA